MELDIKKIAEMQLIGMTEVMPFMTRIVSVAEMAEMTVELLKENLSTQELEEIHRWYNSPLAIGILRKTTQIAAASQFKIRKVMDAKIAEMDEEEKISIFEEMQENFRSLSEDDHS